MIRFATGVVEVADQFAFLAVDTDDRKPLPQEALPQRGNMLELLIPVRTGVGGDLLPVDAQREIHLVQKTRDGIGGYRNIELLPNLPALLRRLPCPLQSRDGIAGGIPLPYTLKVLCSF